MLASAGQPIFAEDTWLHLSLGRVYAAQGPWLEADPLLHTATGPPAPSAWLFDVGLHGLERAVGFQGLRAAHALVVLAILVLAWSLLRRASDSPAFASLGTALFVALSAYRLFQLRPHLLTVLATLLLIRVLVLPRGLPSWRRVASIAGLFALWANVHAAFVLGLALLGAAAAGAALASIRDAVQRPRARRLAIAFGLAGLATLANPAFAGPHLLYFSAGGETPGLALVQDEWARFPLLALPVPRVPPSPLAWATVIALLLAAPAVALRRLRADRGDAPLAALAAASLAGMLAAVRLSWLGIAPLALLGRGLAARGGASRGTAWTLGLASLLVAPAFLVLGDWPMISRGVHPSVYAMAYPIAKHETHAVWWLRDTGLEGDLWNDYADGNFLGYWLAPRLRVFVNGSLNVPPDVMAARAAIAQRLGSDGEDFTGLLDRYGVDVFFGSGLPVVPLGARSLPATTTYLEGEPGWIPVFRTPRSAVFLRRDPRNAENLARVVAHYARERVPFDPERGFDTWSVLQRAPRWAIEHGVVPVDFRQLEAAARSLDPGIRGAALGRLAELHALLGDYTRAEAIDRRHLQWTPGVPSSQGRLVWSLLHEGRSQEALDEAARLEAEAPREDLLSALLVDAARRHAELPEAEARALVARLPLLAPGDAARIGSLLLAAEVRSER